jgi:hypothetical protein
MARDHARVKLTIWADDDFRALSPPAQHLYFVLLTSPKLDYCGATDWRPARIAQLAGGWSPQSVEIAGQELAETGYIVVDADAEEVLLRSFVRHDELMEQPNLAVAMKKAHMSLASSVLRGVVIHELMRLRTDKPDLKGWVKLGGWVDDQTPFDPSKRPPFQASGNPSGKGKANPSGNPSGQVSPTTSPSPTPATSPTPPTGKTEGQDLVEERRETLTVVPAGNDEACTQHGMDRHPGCRGCDRGEQRTAQRLLREADLRRRESEAAARDCTRCDGARVIDPETKLPTKQTCNHRRSA